MDPNFPSSYRPISNLRTISKILERLTHIRLSAHFSVTNTLPEFQSGFRPQHSTETSLTKLTSDLLSSTASGYPSLVVSLDLSAAFDCISHNKLLCRLQDNFGLCDKSLKWINSYLLDRTMFVKVQNEVSTNIDVVRGVPQGSVLGPLLFIAYISPVERLITSFQVCQIAYADDLTLYINLESDVFVKLVTCVNAVRDWFMFNDLLLNPEKSQCLQVGTRQQIKTCPHPDLVIGNLLVSRSDDIKLLGVTFDNCLRFNKHISEICSTTSFHTKALKHIRNHIDLPTAKIVASTLIASKL